MNDTMTLQKAYEIKYYEQNLKNELKESSLLNFLQDIATVSAEELGFGPSFVFSNNFAWFVLKYHIELEKPIQNMDSVILKTQPRGAHRLYAYRDFEISTVEAEKIGKASSLWALIDMNAKRMMPMEKALPFMFKYEKRAEDPDFEKIPPVEKADYTKEFEVKFDDVDVNQHANNANYMIWALETLPYAFRKRMYAKTIDIRYRKETTMGTKIKSEVSVVNETTIHRLSDTKDNEELCALMIKWTTHNL